MVITKANIGCFAPILPSCPPNSAADGGFLFAADPNESFDAQPIFWAPEVLPTVLRVSRASASTGSHGYHLDLAGAELRLTVDGWHAVLPLGGTNHRLWLTTLPEQSSIAVELPVDRDFEIRAAAARRLWSAFEQRRTGPLRSNLSAQRRQRLTLALRALDGHAAGNNYRSIAQALFGTDLVTERAWKSHDLRSRTIRLVQNAAMLVRGGYRALLRVGRGQ